MKTKLKFIFSILLITSLISLGVFGYWYNIVRGHSVKELFYLLAHPGVIFQKGNNLTKTLLKRSIKKYEEKKISAIIENKDFNFPKYNFNSIALNRLEKTDLPPTQPILVVVDDEKTKNLGRYLGEILLAEGINEFQLSTISNISSDLLENFDLVILTQMKPELDRTDMFEKYLSCGGNLIILKPDNKFAYLCGLMSTDEKLTDGYIRLIKDSKMAKQFPFENIQFHGVADIYKSKGSKILAYLSENPEAPSKLPAITKYRYGRGTCICFAYDFIPNIVYMRQGNPNLAGKETDGVFGLRPNDMFHDFIDVDRDWIPQADIHQHILSNLILELTIPNKPLPRWYPLPDNAKAIMILSGDGERISKSEFFIKQAEEIETYGGKITYYLQSDTNLTPEQSIWLHSRGHSTSFHPFFSEKIGEAEKVIKHDLIEYWLKFRLWPKTIRTHWLGWYNYTDQPKI